MSEMRKRCLSFVVIGLSALLLSAMFFTGSGWALQAPLSPEELLEQSDLVAEVRVLGVVLEKVETSYDSDKYSTDEVTTYYYCAWAVIDKTIKGSLQPHSTIQIVWTIEERAEPLIGGVYDMPFLPGEKTKAYFKKVSSEKGTVWSTFNWTGKDDLGEPTGGLPKEEGEYVLIE